ncbi:MAG: hypothetical protein K2Y21_09850 [Phycisphaerales bacterium]|nr:hypothetical protein [Phycisphaerales bacterium]
MQDGVNVPMIEPRVVMDFPSNPDGSAPSAMLRFAGDSLYVVDYVWNDPPTRILWWYATPVAAVLLPFAAALALWLLWRLVSRPRRRGLIYCRGCNHELSLPNATIGPDGRAAWTSENARCPECGRRSKPPLVAGSKWRRMTPLVGAMLLMVGCVGTLGSTLNWYVPPRPSYEQTWPVQGLEKYLGSWSVMRRDRGFVDSIGVSRVVRVPLSCGAPREVARVRMPMLQGVLTSPNERYVVLSPLKQRASIRIVEPMTGRSRLVKLGDVDRGYAMPVEFSQDSRFVYVSLIRYRSNEPDELVRVSLETGEHEIIASESAGVPKCPPSDSSARFVVQERDGNLRWAYVTWLESQQQGPLVVRWIENKEGRETRVPFGASYLTRFSWHPSQPRILLHGRDGLFQEQQVPIDGSRPRSQQRLLPYQGVERGAMLFRVDNDQQLTTRMDVPLGVLRGGSALSSAFLSGEVSADGKWIAVFVSTGDPNVVRPASLPPPRPGIRGEIWLWNLCEGNPIQN